MGDTEYRFDKTNIIEELRYLAESKNIAHGKEKGDFDECVGKLENFFRSDSFQKNSENFEQDSISLLDIIRPTITVANTVCSILEYLEPCKVSTIVKATLNIIDTIVEWKVLSKTLQTLLDHEIIGNARTRVQDYKGRLRLLSGSVKDLNNSKDAQEKTNILHDMANEQSVTAGLKDIALVETKIADHKAKNDATDFPELMAHVELYCFLSLLHEILLLYRISILNVHNRQTQRLRVLVTEQRERLKDVLCFFVQTTRENITRLYPLQHRVLPNIARGFKAKWDNCFLQRTFADGRCLPH
ncbi:uncharacterized protein LOC128558568 [Mercenaria mercenaria]|uniref:uncharacterized protein LOC128558568 n=1 Tax=Mercenaria mercenaria TaxID=6596 RepID=UPI00234F4080|nr:uncharacterized protein LOC128558568 [Mercenaria mercenaria]XP_053404215.1 uncharacterized protein LOC128558568 [Mercenaria mercenaria]